MSIRSGRVGHDVARPVADLEELQLALARLGLQPALDGHCLAGMPGDLLNGYHFGHLPYWKAELQASTWPAEKPATWEALA